MMLGNRTIRHFLQRLMSRLGRPPALRGLVALVEPRFPTEEALAGLSPATRYLMVGLVGLIGLVVVATVSGIVAVKLSATSQSAWSSLGASGVSAAESRRDKAYRHVTARPLFSRNRQETLAIVDNPPVVAPVSVALDQGFVLRGVYINGSSAKAFLTSTQNPVGSWVYIDGEIAGWRLIDVKPQQVMLEGQGEKLALMLSVIGK